MLFISAVCACEGMSHQKTGYSTGSLLAVSMMVIHACEMINKSPSFARLDISWVFSQRHLKRIEIIRC